MDEYNIDILNQGQETTWENKAGHKTPMDISLATLGLANDISDWHVTNDDTDTDHRLLSMQLAEASSVVERKRNFKNINCNQYRFKVEYLSKDWVIPTQTPLNGIDQLAETTISYLNQAVADQIEYEEVKSLLHGRNGGPLNLPP